MKKILLTILLIGFFIHLRAINYYISSSDPLANDVNSGTSALNPWQSFTPLNAIVAFSQGDILLKCGDTFRGQININSAIGLYIGSYGTGAKPIVTGADVVSNWTVNGNYYEATNTKVVKNFFVNGKEQILARYPDDGTYLTVDSATQSFLQDASLSGISSSILNSSKVCIHTAQWCWEKTGISNSTSSQINYSTNTMQTPKANFGYFLYDHISYLTISNEWQYDSLLQKLYYKPASGSPNAMTCEVSVRDYGILFGPQVSNVTVQNIAFEKQVESGISYLFATNTNVLIDNCTFTAQYKYGVEAKARNTEIKNCTFREVDGIATYVYGSASSSSIHHNTYRNIGQFRNSGIGQEINLSAITIGFIDSCYIHHNDIDSAGYCGISVDGKRNLTERNIIKNVMLINNDGAALKSFGATSQYNVFKNNILTKGDGSLVGIPSGAHFITPAIYFDLNVNNCTVQENTVYDRTQKGIFLNSGTYSNSIIGNVVHGANYAIDYNGSPLISTPMTGMLVKRNVFFAKDPLAYLIRMLDNTGGYNQGTMDSNYYFQPYNASRYAQIIPSSNYSFAQWQGTGLDAHSKKSYVSWTLPTSYDTLLVNATDNTVTIPLLANQYFDLDSNTVCNSITLQPYTSMILIKGTNLCSSLPVTYLSFSGRKDNETNVLSWSTSSETNNLGFEIQRSDDGNSFEKIAFVPGRVNSNIISNYSFVDYHPFYKISYYRLKQLDYEGKFSFSNIVSIENENATGLHFYPNPFYDVLYCDVDRELPYIIYDITGLIIKSGILQSHNKIDTEDMKQGIYFLKVENQIYKVIKAF